VMVDGRWLMRDTKFLTIDYTKAKQGLEEQNDRLMAKVNKSK
jgi:hypothetical protein